MSERPPSQKPSTTDQILDLLLDALQERQAARQRERSAPPKPVIREPDVAPPPTGVPMETSRTPAQPASKAMQQPPATRPAAEPPRPVSSPEKESTPPPPLPHVFMERFLARFLIGLVAIVVAINIPLNAAGVSLARAMPDTRSLIIRDGLVLKGSGPEIYVLQDGKLRWITSLDAFTFFGYYWGQVNVVEDSFIQQFELGRPIHVLLKCEPSPHIYALEVDKKRWIKDIPTFEAEGFVWEDVKFVTCDTLRSLPDGPPIPPDAGPPPQP